MTDKPDMKSRPVRAGETPLDANLGHRYLDVFREGGEAFDNRTASPYSGHSLEHCLHAAGWVQRDLRVALDSVLAEREATEARHAAELRGQAERFEAFRQEVSDAVEGFWNYCRTTNTPFPADLDSFILPAPDPLVEAIRSAMPKALVAYDSYDAIVMDVAAAVRKIGEAGHD